MDIRWRLSLACAAFAAYAWLSHTLMTQAPDSAWALAIVLGPMAFASVASLWQWRWRLAAVAAATLWVALTISAGAHGATVPPQWLYLAQHVGVHGALALAFGMTLRRSAVPLVEQMAARVHALTPEMRAYIRKVTWAWTAYFTAIATISLVLFVGAPFATWSLFANIGTPASLLAMFTGEYTTRYWLHPEFERVGLIASIRAYAQPMPRASSETRV